MWKKRQNILDLLGMKIIYYVNLKNEANRGDIEVIERKDSYIEVKWKKGSHRFL